MKTEGNSVWKVLSGISFAGSAITLWFGFDKMLNYVNDEHFWADPHNMYVGGDAYNYIINGNYATGFFVLTAMLALMGVGFIALYYLSKMCDGQEKLIESAQTMESGIHSIDLKTKEPSLLNGESVDTEE